MALTQEKLTQNVTAQMWGWLSLLRDADYQLRTWVKGKDVHAFEDLLNNFDTPLSGTPGRSFARQLAELYKNYGIPVANAILPVYVAIESCPIDEYTTADSLVAVLSSPEWHLVVKRSAEAFEFIDNMIPKDESGWPISYDPTSGDPL